MKKPMKSTSKTGDLMVRRFCGAALLLGVSCILIFASADSVLQNNDEPESFMMMDAVPEDASSMMMLSKAAPMMMDADDDSRDERAFTRSSNRGRTEGASLQYAQEKTLGSDFVQEGSSHGAFDASETKTMLVRRGRIEITTYVDLETLAKEAVSAIDLIDRTGAWYVESRDSSGGWLDGNQKRHDRSVQLTVRVPVEHFFGIMLSLKSLVDTADVVSSSESVSDVTGEFVDAASRAASLLATHAQLLKLMARANDVTEVLAVQKELSRVTQQVEAKQAQVSRLSKSAALSTITLYLQQREALPRPPARHSPKKWSLVHTFNRAVKWVGKLAGRVTDGMVFFLVLFVPVAVVGIFIWVLIVWCCCGPSLRVQSIFSPFSSFSSFVAWQQQDDRLS
uniref:DUF4349 domain-containing protein n=1 Tax=Octactis speculum TaxID=3111310 RepID=A0A7S2HLC3_9STRA